MLKIPLRQSCLLSWVYLFDYLVGCRCYIFSKREEMSLEEQEDVGSNDDVATVDDDDWHDDSYFLYWLL